MKTVMKIENLKRQYDSLQIQFQRTIDENRKLKAKTSNQDSTIDSLKIERKEQDNKIDSLLQEIAESKKETTVNLQKPFQKTLRKCLFQKDYHPLKSPKGQQLL